MLLGTGKASSDTFADTRAGLFAERLSLGTGADFAGVREVSQRSCSNINANRPDAAEINGPCSASTFGVLVNAFHAGSPGGFSPCRIIIMES